MLQYMHRPLGVCDLIHFGIFLYIEPLSRAKTSNQLIAQECLWLDGREMQLTLLHILYLNTFLEAVFVSVAQHPAVEQQ